MDSKFGDFGGEEVPLYKRRRQEIKENIRNPYFKLKPKPKLEDKEKNLLEKKEKKKEVVDPFILEEKDREERLSIRSEEENMIDILLSGSTATLIIQTQKKIYIGWVGDSLVAL
jgi:serine/threonine protein phosphatase PrpC